MLLWIVSSPLLLAQLKGPGAALTAKDLIGPILITFLLMKVSGVAMLDAALVDRRPGYAEHIRSTPAFFPRLRPKPGSSRGSA